MEPTGADLGRFPQERPVPCAGATLGIRIRLLHAGHAHTTIEHARLTRLLAVSVEQMRQPQQMAPTLHDSPIELKAAPPGAPIGPSLPRSQ